MFQQIPVNDDKIVAYRISGKLSHADYQAFLPQIEAILDKEKPLSLFIELDNFKGWDLKSFLDDFSFSQEHADDLDRIAIVGNQSWQKWMTRLAQPFIQSEIKYFTQEQLIEAWDWLRRKGEENPKQPLKPYKHILVPVDFSRYSRRILQRAQDLGKRYQAKLSVIHVFESLPMYSDFYDGFFDTYAMNLYEQEQELLKLSQQQMQRLLQEMDMTAASHEIIQGSTVSSILSYAEAQEIDLIIMGTHGHKGLERLLGSTASGVVHKSRCEVLTVPVS